MYTLTSFNRRAACSLKLLPNLNDYTINMNVIADKILPILSYIYILCIPSVDQYRIRGHSGYLLAGERNCIVHGYERGLKKCQRATGKER